MHRSIATVSMSGTLRQKLEAIAAAGFDGFELFEPDFIHFDGSAHELRRIATDLGLSLDLFQPLRDFEGMPDELHRRNLERAERKFDLMQALGAPLMLVCSNTSPHSLGDASRAAAQLHELAERASRRGLRIGFEALAWGRWVKLYRQAWDIVQRADHPALGLILDSFHTLSLNDDPAGLQDIPGERIFFLQMADAPRMAMDVLQWARHHRNFPGQGELPVEAFLEQVLRTGYTGPLSLEIFNDVFRGTPNRRTAVDAMRSLLLLESRVKQRLEAAGAAPRVELFQAPQAPALEGCAFIEFAVDEQAEKALATLLHRLGFQRVGRHRSKAATLYRQGDIQFVVNAEPGSHARSRFDDLGPCVCAIGLSTADAEAAARRAVALCSARWDSPRAPGELALPGIVAPGGTLLHFVPQGQSLDADFEGPAPAPASCGLRTVDHVAMGLAREQFDTWVLFGRAVLDLQQGESLELADPFGLIRSSGFATRSRALRLVLNVSTTQATRTARQVGATGPAGGSVHHIALSSDDIFGSVEQLRSNGVRFVPISRNYYDDLLARLPIDEALVGRMRALDILYDEAADGGRYFHAYTEPFADRFFFEVVQRLGYDGYGAANAPARMASQEQKGPAR
jgi:4-hydroxyphenylpyruvate dioxygenase